MKKILLLLAICSAYVSFAQYQVTVNALVLDKNTNEPIPYVNIGFVDKAIGTVSNNKGEFQLIYDEDLITDSSELQISSLGYETLKVTKKQLERYLINTNKILLTPKVEELSVVTISNDKTVQVRLGSFESKTKLMGYWKDAKALGGELATKINVRSKNTQLLDLKFNIIENASDSIKVRVNIYNYKKRFPGEKGIKQNIFHTIKNKSGVETIDLSPYNIIVDEDVIVSLELLEVYGDNIGFAISARRESSGNSFIKYISQDKWQRMINTSLNLSLLTSETISIKDEETSRAVPNNITIYWDHSQSMQNRDLKKELNFLKAYLNNFKKLNVEVIAFNFNAQNNRKFVVNDGNSVELIEHLKSFKTIGATNYKNVLKENAFNAQTILLFTDGITTFESLQQEINVPVFTVNSKKEADHYTLQKTAFYADGYYINLNEISENKALEVMLKQLNDREVYEESNLKNTISGEVLTGNLKLQGVTVSVKNSYRETKTDVDGQFTIQANEEEVLQFSFIDMLSKEVAVTNEDFMKVELNPNTELLEEVLINAESKNTELKETTYGKVNSSAIGYSVDELTEEDIRPGMIFLSDLIRGRFPGVRVFGTGDQATYQVRALSSIENPAEPIWVVDGVIFETTPFFISPQDISSISVIKSLAGTVRYGTLGRGGVFIIKTKNQSFDAKAAADTLLVKGNDYAELVPSLESLRTKSPLVKRLEATSSYQEALTMYQKIRGEKELQGIPFYFDASDYFMRWNKEKAIEILSTIAEVAPTNIKALKALAYKFESLKMNEEAKYIYEDIYTQRPNDAQSYRDLALIYTKVGKYVDAADIYKRILGGVINNVDFTGLGKTIETEFKYLLMNHRASFYYKDLPADLLSGELKYDLRIVFEWTDPNTEFEFQFVTPKKKSYKWPHTLLDNKERMIDEINNGYHTEEYIIDQADAGEWIINIECFSEESPINPTFLKYTVYKNYGHENQTETIKVIKLYEQKQKVTLDTFDYK